MSRLLMPDSEAEDKQEVLWSSWTARPVMTESLVLVPTVDSSRRSESQLWTPEGASEPNKEATTQTEGCMQR